MQLFSSVLYHISPSLSEQRRSELQHILESNGATQATERVDATHVVTNTPRFEGWQDIPVAAHIVTDKWVERSLVLGKTQLPQHYSANPDMVFSGVVACATDLSAADMEILSAGISALGGQWRTWLSKDVTHVFATSPTSELYATAIHFSERTGMHVVLPHWFDDAVRLGMGSLSVTPYAWPDPPILKTHVENSKQKIETEKNPSKKSLYATAVQFTPTASAPSISNPVPLDAKPVWAGRRVLISSSLEMTSNRRDAIEASIKRGGGELVHFDRDAESEWVVEVREAEAVDECDVFVTRWRTGPAYARAFRSGKTIGTLAWLFHIQQTGILSPPLDQLLHYPVPKRPIPKFSGHEMTLTNYTGEARDYLKKLIAAMGAKFTPSMSNKNTVLIAAYISGNKTSRAVEWSIPIVNHTWLEDCFIRWSALTVGAEKYIIFPPGVDFSTLLGERGVRAVDLARELEEEEINGEINGETIHLENVAQDAQEEVVNLFQDKIQKGKPGRGTKSISVNDDDDRIDRTSKRLGVPQGKTTPKKHSEGERTPAPSPAKSLDGRSSAGALTRSSPVKRNVRKSIRTPNIGKDTSDSDAVEVVAMDVNANAKNKTAKIVEGKRSTKPCSVRGKKIQDEYVENRRKSPSKKSTRNILNSPDDEDVNEEDQQLGDVSDGQKSVKSRVEAQESPLTPQDAGKLTGRSRNEGSHARTNVKKRSLRTVADGDLGTELSELKNKRNAKPSSSSKTAAKRDVSLQEKEQDDTSDTDDIPEPTRHLKNKVTRVMSVVKPNLVLVEKKPKSTRGKVKKAGDVEHILVTSVDNDLSTRPLSRKSSARSLVSEHGGQDFERPTSSSRKGRSSNARDNDEEDEQVVNYNNKPQAAKTTSPPSLVPHRRRSAAVKATNQLRDVLMPDLNLYQNEIKRSRRSVGGMDGFLHMVDATEKINAKTHPRKRDPDNVDEQRDEVKKRKLNRSKSREKEVAVLSKQKHVNNESDDEVDVNKPPVRVMTTQVSLTDAVIKALGKLGVKMTARPSECTHLLVPQIVRTEKFLCALARAPYILTEKWAIESVAAKTLLPEERYLVHDKSGEQKYAMRLSKTIERARQLGGKLFSGITFYVTPKVAVDIQLLKNVAFANGGLVNSQTPTLRILKSDDGRRVISCLADSSIWRPLASNGVRVYTSELLLMSALNQEIKWDADDYVLEEAEVERMKYL